MKNVTRIMALLLAVAMVATLGLAGCAAKPATDAPSADTPSTDAPATDAPAADAAAITIPDTGKELTIYAWNEEFKGMLENYMFKEKNYATYKKVTDDAGVEKEVVDTYTLPNGLAFNFVINPNDGGVYQQKLDQALQAGEVIDMFLIEADYALKYVNSEYTLPISDAGITADMLANQYKYTIDVATDPNGVIKGTSWQAAPGLFMYRASLAEKFLGAKTPEEMQALVSDWTKFVDTAKKVKEASAGATKLVPSTGDVWQVFRSNRATSWVTDGKLTISPEVDSYLELAKTLQTEGLTADAGQWSEAWNLGLSNDSIMGYFFSTWGIQWTMVGNSGGTKPGEGTYGDWRAITGPQSYYWGGTWLTACKTADNGTMINEIMKYFTVDTASMKNYCLGSKDYVNNKAAIKEITDAGFSFDFLGGQDHYSLFQVAADKVNTSTMSAYDQDINTAFNEAVTAYSKGEKSKDDAMKEFKAAVGEKFADITVE